jgi:hypothetical protein
MNIRLRGTVFCPRSLYEPPLQRYRVLSAVCVDTSVLEVSCSVRGLCMNLRLRGIVFCPRSLYEPPLERYRVLSAVSV